MDPLAFVADADQWQRVRSMRLRALRSDPEAYGATADHESEYDEAHWREHIARDRWILVCVDDSDVAIAGVSPRMPDVVIEHCAQPRGAWIYGCWVDPVWRGRGIAGMLLEQGRLLAIEWGLPQVGLGVFTTNEPARRSYERLGLRPMCDPLPSMRRAGMHFQPMGMPSVPA